MKHDQSIYGGKEVTTGKIELNKDDGQNDGFHVTEKCRDDDDDTGDVCYNSNDHDKNDNNNNNNNNNHYNNNDDDDDNDNNDDENDNNDETPPLSPSLFNSSDPHNDTDTISSLPYIPPFPILTVPESVKNDLEHSLSIEHSAEGSTGAQHEKNIWDF